MREYGFSLTRILPYNDRIVIKTRILANFAQCFGKTAEYVLKNNYLELNSNVKHQISRTAIVFVFMG